MYLCPSWFFSDTILLPIGKIRFNKFKNNTTTFIRNCLFRIFVSNFLALIKWLYGILNKFTSIANFGWKPFLDYWCIISLKWIRLPINISDGSFIVLIQFFKMWLILLLCYHLLCDFSNVGAYHKVWQKTKRSRKICLNLGSNQGPLVLRSNALPMSSFGQS